MKIFKMFSCLMAGLLFILLSPAYGPAEISPALEKAGDSAVTIEFFDEHGKLLRKGCGVIIDESRVVLTMERLFYKALSAEVKTSSGESCPIKGICGENKELKLWKAAFEIKKKALLPAPFAESELALEDEVFVVKDPGRKEGGFLKGKVVEKGSKFRIMLSSNIPASLMGAPIFNSKGQLAGILTDINRKKETPYGLVAPITSKISFKNSPLLGILDWKIKKEKEWKESPKGLRHAITYYTLKKEYESAIPLILKLIEKLPQDAHAHCRLGYCYGGLKQFEEAIGAYKKAVELAPNNPQNHYNLGNAYAAAGKYEEAASACEKAVEIDPKNQWAHFNLGIIYLAMGDEKMAMKEVEILKQSKATVHLAEKLLKAQEEYRSKKGTTLPDK